MAKRSDADDLFLGASLPLKQCSYSTSALWTAIVNVFCGNLNTCPFCFQSDFLLLLAPWVVQSVPRVRWYMPRALRKLCWSDPEVLIEQFRITQAKITIF